MAFDYILNHISFRQSTQLKSSFPGLESAEDKRKKQNIGQTSCLTVDYTEARRPGYFRLSPPARQFVRRGLESAPARTERVRSGGKPFLYSFLVYTEFMKES